MLKRKDSGKSEQPKVFGRYRVLSELGHGAMATVYLAEDPSLNRLVAVKVIHSHLASIGNLLDRFTVEAKTAASLRCPNIVEIFDYGLENGQQYLVMEYIDGPNLQFVLNLMQGKGLETEACAAVIGQAAEGLAAAEKNNVVHRDIKPENMMFTTEGILKIADFGIAHINEQNLTQTGSILGSPSFMSPEQIDGGKPTHQTDMFSLGAVFFYCLTGRKPFAGNNIPTIMRSICDMPHPPVGEMLPGADETLTKIIDTLLQKKPENRGKGARWLSLQIRSYLNQKGILDLPDKVKSLLQEATGQAGDKTMVEAPRPSAPKRIPSPITTKTNATRSFRSGSQTASKLQNQTTLKAKLLSPIGLILSSITLLCVLGLVLWFAFKSASTIPETTSTYVADAPVPTIPKIQKLTTLRLEPEQMELAPGETRFVKVNFEPTDVKVALTWSSTDTSVVEVIGGEVKAIRPGKSQIMVQSDSSAGIRAISDVTVIGAIPKLKPVNLKPENLPKVNTIATVATIKSETIVVSIFSAPPFSEVFIDNKYVGTTPLKNFSVIPGRHRVMISHRDFNSLDTTIILRTSESTLKFRLYEL